MIFCDSQRCFSVSIIATTFGMRACVSVLHQRAPGHPICDRSRVIATRCFTVPSIHHESINCNCFQSHPLCLYKINYNRFNHHERPIFFSASATDQQQSAIFFRCCGRDCAMTLAFHVLQKICRIEYSLQIISTFLTRYKSIIEIIKASRGISIKIYIYERQRGIFLVHHDDVIKWKHFPRCWPYVQGIHRSPVNSSHKGQ